MAEEMEKVCKKAFEFESKLQKFGEMEKHIKKAKESQKWRKPGRSEAVDKRATKLEELLDDAVEEIQVHIPHYSSAVLHSFRADSINCGAVYIQTNYAVLAPLLLLTNWLVSGCWVAM